VTATRWEVHDERRNLSVTTDNPRRPPTDMHETNEAPCLDPDSGRAEFEQFFARHHRELARLGFLLSGDRQNAEDLTAETFLAAWQRWDTVRSVDQPVAYVRRILVNIAASRLRRIGGERRRMALIFAADRDTVFDPDPGAVLDVRAALLRLPVRRRACVVLRHAFDLSESEVATALGISVGTVKSQTSKGMALLQKLLKTSLEGGLDA
jgi:RNA polymerase sigma-70 factor (sigma-E family)